MTFDDSFKALLKTEGGYSNHPLDSGGETIFGISRNFHPGLKIWSILDKWKENGTKGDDLVKLALLDSHFMELTKSFYRVVFWNKSGCEYVPDKVKYPLFSCAVNCGDVRAVKILQQSVGVLDDGIFGLKTKNAVKDLDVYTFYDNWRKFYEKIVNNKPSQKVFFPGWINRIKAVGVENGDGDNLKI